MCRFQFLVLFQCAIFGILPYFSQVDALKGYNIRPAGETEFPFVVSIGNKVHNGRGENSFCTGALIAKKLVLTAEHCKEALSNLQVTVGSNDVRGGRKYYVSAWTSFNDWAAKNGGIDPNSDNDVAILTLSEEVTDIIPATLSTEQKRKLSGTTAIVAGWGVSQTGRIPRFMETATVKVMSMPDCINKVRQLSGKPRTVVPDKYMCTNADPPTIIQSGDSGGPIFNQNNVIIGVNGATIPKELKDDLSVINIHMTILHYRKFIDAVIAQNQ